MVEPSCLLAAHHLIATDTRLGMPKQQTTLLHAPAPLTPTHSRTCASIFADMPALQCAAQLPLHDDAPAAPAPASAAAQIAPAPAAIAPTAPAAGDVVGLLLLRIRGDVQRWLGLGCLLGLCLLLLLMRRWWTAAYPGLPEQSPPAVTGGIVVVLAQCLPDGLLEQRCLQNVPLIATTSA